MMNLLACWADTGRNTPPDRINGREVNCNAIDQFKTALLAEQAFELDNHSIEFFGRCARCR